MAQAERVMSNVEQPPRLAIIGAGPVGFEAALQCAARKVPFAWYERGQPGEHLAVWGHLETHGTFSTLVSQAGMDALTSAKLTEWLPSPGSHTTGKSWAEGYLLPLAETPELLGVLKSGVEVVAASRFSSLREDDQRAGGFLLHLRQGAAESVVEVPAVIDCTGVLAQPRPMGRGGISAPGESSCREKIAYFIEDILGADKDKYAGKSVVVVGGGISAATAVTLLAELAKSHQSTWVTWLVRREGSLPVRRQVHDHMPWGDKIAAMANHLAARGSGNVEFHGGCWIDGVRLGQNNQGVVVTSSVKGITRSFEADRVVSLCGYQPSKQLTRELRFTFDPVLDLPPTGLLPDPLLSPGPEAYEPGWYTIGSKSYGRASGFLVSTGYRQAALAVARELDGKPLKRRAS
jgi:thioredoxin reductase